MNRRLAVLLIVVLVTACAPLTPRRVRLVNHQWVPQAQAPIPELPDTDENLNPKRASDAARSISKSSWEHYKSFDVGIIEFTEWGGLWSEEQRKLVIEKVRTLSMEQGATVVVYAHGWHHSARWNDTNLVSFRHVLRFLAARGRGGMRCTPDVNAKSSRVIGIYVGWRGESIPVPGVNLTTIWSRKRVAQAIGGPSTNWEARKVRLRLQRQPQLANVLRDLDKIRDDANSTAVASHRPFTSLTITGHSLGGAMLLSAMQQIVFDKTIDDNTPIDPGALHRVGDAVILINPAVEARRYRTFRAESSKKDFGANQLPILLVLSSTGDTPNKVALKMARFFVTLFTPGRWREWADSTTALGFSLADISHRLLLNKSKEGKELFEIPIDKLEPEYFPEGIRPDEKDPTLFSLAASRKFPPLELKNLHDSKVYNPFMVIQTDKAVIRGHNDIFSSGVMSFLIPFVSASQRKSVLPLCVPKIAQQAPAAR